MPRRYPYLVTSLPTLGAPGSLPPLAPPALLERLDGPARRLAETVFLADDLLQRESSIAGGRAPLAPAALTLEQVRDEAPLPDELSGAPLPSEPDRLWAAFFRHAASVARRLRSAALAAWVAHEVGLRNALAVERARRLALDAAGPLVTPELGLPVESYGAVVREWSAAPDPLSAERVLDQARWRWIDAHDDWFRFTQDEIAAYAVRLSIVARWHRWAAEARA